MANFNIVVLPAKVLRDGTHKVRIAISHRGDTRYIPTNYRVDSPSEVSNNQIVGRGDAGYLNIQLIEDSLEDFLLLTTLALQYLHKLGAGVDIGVIDGIVSLLQVVEFLPELDI